jgi:selenocysteine-specific elongation factor
VVVDASPMPIRTYGGSVEAFLKILRHGDPEQILSARVARRGYRGLTTKRAIAETGWTRPQLDGVLKEITRDGRSTLQIGNILVSRASLEGAKLYTTDRLKGFHQKNPLAGGMNKEALREDLQLGLSSEVFAAVLESLIAEGKIEISGENVRIAGQAVVMKDDEAESKRIIEQAFESAGLKVPALKDVLAGLKIDRARAQRIVTLLLRERVLFKLNEDLVFHRDALESLRQLVREQKTTSPRMDVARFKDLTGVSRKYAIPLLEYLDRERITRRVGDERLIL